MKRLPRQYSGFTLVELAIVLFIVSLLIGGLLMPLSAQYEVRGRQETDRALTNIREALLGFAIVNGRLPCPADPSIATGAANAGVEQRSGTGPTPHDNVCTFATGVLPWATLGLPETDAWNNRFSYRATSTFSRGVDSAPTTTSAYGAGCALTAVADMPTRSAFALCTQGDIAIKVSAGGIDLATAIPAIVVSHGKNGLGAYRTDGIQISGAAGDELENANGDTTFVRSSEIDDLVMWLPTSVLMGRMLAAGRLP